MQTELADNNYDKRYFEESRGDISIAQRGFSSEIFIWDIRITEGDGTMMPRRDRWRWMESQSVHISILSSQNSI